MRHYYFVEGFFVLLGMALMAVAIKYPKDVFIKLPLELMKLPFKPFDDLFPLFDSTSSIDEDKPYPSRRRLPVDFLQGCKFIYVLKSTTSLNELLAGFLEIPSETYAVEDFTIVNDDRQTILQFPADITFYNYHLAVQYFDNELGSRNSFGVFRSSTLQYYVFQDRATLNNFVGFTADGKLFSIYMLGDLDEKHYLRLNQKLEVDTGWIDRAKFSSGINVNQC